jgi:hypothetical protein
LAQIGIGIEIGAHGRDGTPVTISRIILPCDDVTDVTVDSAVDFPERNIEVEV